MQKEISLIDSAVAILETEKKAIDIYQLFDVVTKGKQLSENVKSDIVTKFYTDLTTSAKFVYVGDNKWDLKANQKIELWEKDGSFYKEYTVVELPEDYKEPTKPAVAKKPRKSTKKAAKAEVVVPVEAPIEVPAEVKLEEVVVAKPITEDAKATTDAKATSKDEVVEVYEEEIFEEYSDFDEEKYNEYMDTYEDQYDK